MWSSSRMVRSAVLFVALALLPALSACTGFHPVYGLGAALVSEGKQIAYAAPRNRTEQIIYQDLMLRMPPATGKAPKLTISAGAGARALTSETISTAQTAKQVTVTASIRLVSPSGKVLFSGSRSQTADLSTGPQVLANERALEDATERAAHLLADTIRLTVLGALSK